MQLAAGRARRASNAEAGSLPRARA